MKARGREGRGFGRRRLRGWGEEGRVRGQGQRPCREIINIRSKLCMYTAVKERRGEGAKDQIFGGRRKCVCVCGECQKVNEQGTHLN